jgi:hypothetical protein
MKPIHTPFIVHPQIDQQSTAKPGGQANQINQKGTFIFFETSEDQQEVLSEHGLCCEWVASADTTSMPT